MALFLAVGAGIDLARAYIGRQKLDQTAVLACQYASRPSIIKTSYDGVSGQNAYGANVTAFIGTTLQGQSFQWPQTNAAPFTFVAKGAADVRLTSSVPTTLMKIARIDAIPISATAHCFDTPAEPPQRVPDGSNPNLVNEGFETPNCSGCYVFTNPDGTPGNLRNPQQTPTSSPGYTGSSGARWYIMGYCVEIDSAGVIKASVPQGRFSAELDCENGSGQSGNSSISTKVYLPVGSYELRYNYVSRVFYGDYAPAYVCGSAASDVSWANSTRSVGGPRSNVLRSNQINVYLDPDVTGSAPIHVTQDGAQNLAGSNLIDVCVDSTSWIERSVRINVTSPNYYWLSFAADGANDSYGGQIDDIRLCLKTCTDSLDDNFPSSWLASNNGGVNKQLFAEGFQSPAYTKDSSISENRTKGGNLALAYGTSGTAASGWPSQLASGWAVAPYNQMNMWLTSTGMSGPSPGTQFISLVGWNGFSNASDPLNRSISRPFLLDPGYYTVSYTYVSLLDFSYDFIYGTNCTTAPTFMNNLTAYGKKNGHKYGDVSTVYNQYQSTNVLNVHMANAQLVSTPSVNTTLGGAPTYTNPNGTTSSSPTVPLDNGTNFAPYNASAVNPVIDTCSYSGGFAWTPRSVTVKITKPGWYWLAFSAQGDPVTVGTAGPGVDNIKLTALGSLFMSNPPSPAVAIPVSNPQPGVTVAFSGFSIVANPLTPPAP